MLCSDCSAVVRPVVAVDIDGTLGDYHGHFIEFATRYLNAESQELYTKVTLREPYDGREQFKDWACRVFGIDERTWRDIKLAYRQGAQKRSMPIYGGAVELCQAIQEAGAELWLTTTRPYQRLDNIDPDTRAWLALHGIEYDGLLYDELKYERLASIVDNNRVVAIIDDLPEMYEAASQNFGWRVPLLRKTPYNAGIAYDGPDGIDAITRTVVERINSWRERYESQSSSVRSA